MRILGIDPGTQRTGVGLIQASGNSYSYLHCEVITLSRNLEIPQKLYQIYQSLSLFIEELKPDVMALEDLFYGKDLRAMVRIGEARACAMLAASERGLPVIEYTPTRVKKAISGNGRATKTQVKQMVKMLLNMKTLPPDDGADALAIAICHAQNKGSLQIAKQAGKRLASLRK